jgi:hypothetical protein
VACMPINGFCPGLSSMEMDGNVCTADSAGLAGVSPWAELPSLYLLHGRANSLAPGGSANSTASLDVSKKLLLKCLTAFYCYQQSNIVGEEVRKTVTKV